ncbi:AzlC family ABC transporter permease [Brachybacterium saurashtrense]|uniref:Branched-chain amino acid ABC transporter permease n=1 Tax=Brachybacterium saurashtrense TaxID=556288 RepID=A0A345YKZ9_9MICO|nr:AzlC family ABC transporter permease [Brachybacterium saurashtrense]AXK44601.1 branched-chain amino acid ABC transporter permease [Brachybacterium saurashtrense]RRR23213.1 branched-chain amino acid ABC transporter permease [Brachybacterium saurashtrense]
MTDASTPVPGRAPSSSATASGEEAAALRGLRRTGVSIGLATGLYGISFGALATTSGLDVWQAMVLSAVMFTGGSQFAFIGVLGGGGSAFGAALASLLLGVRNTLYGLILAPSLPRGGVRGLARAQLTIDESAALAATGTTIAQKRAGFWAAGVWVYVFWTLFSLVGALAGRHVADPAAWGLDAAAAAAFLALLWPRLRSGDAVAIAGAAAFVALVTTPALPAGLPVLAAALVAVLAGLLPPRRPVHREGVEPEGPAGGAQEADGAEDRATDDDAAADGAAGRGRP